MTSVAPKTDIPLSRSVTFGSTPDAPASSRAPKIALPSSITRTQSGTVISMAPKTQLATQTTSGASNCASRKSSSTAPNTAVALNSLGTCQPPLRDLAEKMARKPRVGAEASGAAGTGAGDGASCGLRSWVSTSSSPSVRALSARPISSLCSSTLRRPSAVAEASTCSTRSRSASEARVVGECCGTTSDTP